MTTYTFQHLFLERVYFTDVIAENMRAAEIELERVYPDTYITYREVAK